MRISDVDGQVSLFAQDGCAGKMSRAHSAQGRQRERIFSSFSRKLSELKTIPFLSLDLTPGHGNLLGESYWELISPSPGGSSTLNTGPAPLREEDVYTLSRILQDDPPLKYYLSKTACRGILRRARERGKDLPEQLELALRAQSGLTPVEELSAMPLIAFAANQRDEVRDLHGVTGALAAQAGMKQQTFIAQDCMTPWDTQQTRIYTPDSKAPTLAGADGGGGRNPGGLLFTGGETPGCLTPWDTQQARISTPSGVAPTINSGELKPGGLLFAAGFCAGASPAAGSIGYQEEVSPTLKGSASGNMMPSVLCLNDQGGSVMECSEDVSGTLRAQEHGHQPLVVGLYENHGIDARYTGPHPISPTLPARAGTGGNNLPLVTQPPEALCILGNTVDCASENGGHGLGVQEELAYTLTSEHQHAVYSRRRVDVFKDNDVASTESARQHKDATDLIMQVLYQDTVGALTSSDHKGPNSQYVGQDKLIVDGVKLIRRLTPLECERLQGYPDGWTDLPGASDSARYRALGNSVAVPCVEYVMRGFAMAVDPDGDNTSSRSRGRSPRRPPEGTNR